MSIFSVISNRNYSKNKQYIPDVVSIFSVISNRNGDRRSSAAISLCQYSLLYQTATFAVNAVFNTSCVNILYYIKPQLGWVVALLAGVVSIFSIISNRNVELEDGRTLYVVSIFSIISNRNRRREYTSRALVVSIFSIISNRNFLGLVSLEFLLCQYSLLYQTATLTVLHICLNSCVNILYYIKPQRFQRPRFR